MNQYSVICIDIYYKYIISHVSIFCPHFWCHSHWCDLGLLKLQKKLPTRVISESSVSPQLSTPSTTLATPRSPH